MGMLKKVTLQEATTALRKKQNELENCERAVEGLIIQLFAALKSRERVQDEMRATAAMVRTLSDKR